MHRQGQLLIEVRIVGRYARVAALDPVTLTEAVVVGPAGAPRERLAEAAAAKLRYLLTRPAT